MKRLMDFLKKLERNGYCEHVFNVSNFKKIMIRKINELLESKDFYNDSWEVQWYYEAYLYALKNNRADAGEHENININYANELLDILGELN